MLTLTYKQHLIAMGEDFSLMIISRYDRDKRGHIFGFPIEIEFILTMI